MTVSQKREVPAERCQQYCCSAFKTFKDTKLTKIPDLNIPIHPIFRRENFSDEFNYDLIEMPLRLASLFLKSDALVPFWNIVAEGEIRTLDGKETTLAKLNCKHKNCVGRCRKFERYPNPGQDRINKQNKRRARRILDELADMVEFDVEALTEVTPASAGNLATCQAVEGPLHFKSANFFHRGHKSLIKFSRSKYDLVRSAAYFMSMKAALPERYCAEAFSANCFAKTKVASSDADSAESFRMDRPIFHLFSFARIICHELAHALNIAACRRRFQGPFYKDSLVSELGLELEKQLFGGQIEDWEVLGHNKRQVSKGASQDAENQQRVALGSAMSELPSHTINLLYGKTKDRLGAPHTGRCYDVIW